MQRIKSVFHRSNRPSRRTGKVASVLVMLFVLGSVTSGILATLHPAPVLAAGQVTVTDNVNFTSTPPANEDIFIGNVKKDGSGCYPSNYAVLANPKVSGKVATFTTTFSSVSSVGQTCKGGKNYSPIPGGQYSATSLDTGQTKDFSVSNDGSGSVTLGAAYNQNITNCIGSSGGASASAECNSALQSTVCNSNPSSQLCSFAKECTSTNSSTSCNAVTVCAQNPTSSDCKTATQAATCADNPAAANCANSSNATDVCESSGFNLSWIACPVLNAMTDIETSLQGVVDSLLKTQPIVFSSKDCNSSASDSAAACTFAVWSSFRVYADVLLVIGLLVAVFGEAVGGGLIDAYTARKMLPRVVVAAILINLSIYIVAIMEDIVNILAAGVYDLISEPFKAAGVWHLNFNGASADLSGFAMIAAFLGSALAIHSLLKAKELGDAVIALAFLVGVPVLLAILGVIVTILFRTGILILLVMVSPIAFSAYVLPNTEQYFKKWWKLLMETLLVYPIVNLVFAMATVTGIVISRSGVGGIGWIGQILGAVAVVAPLFLIPYAFKFAGSTMGAIHDTVMNYKNRAHGALKGDEKNPNSLHNRMRRRLGNARNEAGLTGAQIGENFNPRNNIFTAAGRARRTARIGSRREAGQALLGQQAMESDPIIQANKNNDKFLTAVANRKHAETLRAKALKDGETATVAAWDQALSAASQVHGDAATRHAAAQAWAATGYNLGTGQEGYNQLAETMAAVTGAQLERDASGNVVGVKAGDPNAGAYANAMNSAQFNLKNAGRFDLAGINDGKGYNAELGLGKVDPYTMASRAKPDTIKQKGAMMRESLAKAKDAAQAASDARRAGNAKEADRQMAIYNAEMHNAEVHRIEMDTIRDNATGKNKSTAEEEMATVAGDADLASWRDGVIRDKSGAAETIDSRINYINDTATPGWSAEEKARGWRTERVQKTKGMQARADAQGGRRPNPSELEEH